MHNGNVTQAITQRGSGRIWQARRANGANTLTIAAGHAIDALCFVVGEFNEVSARLAVTITEWQNTETGETEQVDSPDWVSVSGRLESGAQAAFLVTTVPYNASGNRFEIYGTEGTLVIAGASSNLGPNELRGARRSDPLSAMQAPAQFLLAPRGTPDGPARNVAQAYARLAAALRGASGYRPDFAHAVKRHKLIEAIERSAAEGRAVQFS